ncbi:MAG: alpha-tubulin N-acetyltransferase [archaeon]|nr:alpha-tubulin N-acetyltransferase [archaeon]
MQFNFDCEQALGCDSDGFAVLEGSYQNRIVPGFTLFVNEILDTMGELSSKAQKLNTIITSALKFFGSNHRIVIKAKGNTVLGILKVGVKKLFLRDELFNYHEVSPLCLLDFYVHESCQRQGIGKQLFDYMLMFEKKRPEQLAYDKPSDKSINFLKKHYGLTNYVRQNNNFVVYNEFFDSLGNTSNEDNKVYDRDTNRAVGQRSPYSQTYDLSSVNISGRKNPYDRTPDRPERNGTPLSGASQNLIYNNTFNNKIVDKNVYKNPTTGFQTYYLNGAETNSYDNIYSRRKIGMINDYMSSLKKEEDEFIHEQIDMKEKSIDNSNGRLNQLQNKIASNPYYNKRRDDELYNKRSHYATIFDDKKIVENNYYNQYNPNQIKPISEISFANQKKQYTAGSQKMQEGFQHYSPFSQYGKVYTNVLPTTSSAYGAYYNNSKELDIRNQSPNRLYY